MTPDQIYCEKETFGERRDGGRGVLAEVLFIQHSCLENKLSLTDQREREREQGGRERNGLKWPKL